ncbi:MAG TPA: serine hydrolase domain-containing protein [Thermoleophilaceae bacterium]
MTQGASVEGHVEPGFEPVADEFARNFTKRGELGAACAAYVGGEKVVDLWGGHSDRARRRRWREDTLVLVYSTSKGMAAMAVALAHSRGLIDYDERVAAYWPEFAEAGKGQITIRQLLAHQAGLCAVHGRLDPTVLADFDELARILARQRPAWRPGTRHGYHALSLGFFESELIRRVDPEHRTLGRFFADEIAAPLGLEFYFGVPEDVPDERIAEIKAYRRGEVLLHLNVMPPAMVAGFTRPRSLTFRAFGNPRLRGPADLNLPEYRAVELPAGAGVGQARGVARAYGEFAVGGPSLGLVDDTLAALAAPAAEPSGGAKDLVLRIETAYSLGFLKPSRPFRFGTSDSAFGHTGAGGSFGYADPDLELGFAYAPNRLGFHLFDDPRDKPLRDALYRCIGAGVRRPARGAA